MLGLVPQTGWTTNRWAKAYEGTPGGFEELDREKERIYREDLAITFPAMRGVDELLPSLNNAHYKLAIGSSGPPENVKLAIEKLKYGNLFQAAVDASYVIRGKPHPQVFRFSGRLFSI